MHADCIVDENSSPVLKALNQNQTHDNSTNFSLASPYKTAINPADASYIYRNEDSMLIKGNTSFNQSFMGDFVLPDLDDGLHHGTSYLQSPVLKPKHSIPEASDRPLNIPKRETNIKDEVVIPIGREDKSKFKEVSSSLEKYLGKKNMKIRSSRNLGSGVNISQESETWETREKSLSSQKNPASSFEKDESKPGESIDNYPAAYRGAQSGTVKDKNSAYLEQGEVKEEQEEEEKGEADKYIPNNHSFCRSSSKKDMRSSISSISQAEKQCKICLENTEDETAGWFVEPCKCIGSVKNVHDLCLKTWIESRNIDPKRAYCELCHAKYKVKFTYKKRFYPRNAIGEGIVSLISGICLLGMVVGLFVLVISLLTTNEVDKNTDTAQQDDQSQQNPEEAPNNKKKSSASVKVFISLVCGIFIAILSFLLCYAWREAFFVSDIVTWEILNYNKSKKKKKVIAVQKMKSQKQLQVNEKPPNVIPSAQGEDVLELPGMDCPPYQSEGNARETQEDKSGTGLGVFKQASGYSEIGLLSQHGRGKVGTDRGHEMDIIEAQINAQRLKAERKDSLDPFKSVSPEPFRNGSPDPFLRNNIEREEREERGSLRVKGVEFDNNSNKDVKEKKSMAGKEEEEGKRRSLTYSKSAVKSSKKEFNFNAEDDDIVQTGEVPSLKAERSLYRSKTQTLPEYYGDFLEIENEGDPYNFRPQTEQLELSKRETHEIKSLEI